jgi:hypothetical protein
MLLTTPAKTAVDEVERRVLSKRLLERMDNEILRAIATAVSFRRYVLTVNDCMELIQKTAEVSSSVSNSATCCNAVISCVVVLCLVCHSSCDKEQSSPKYPAKQLHTETQSGLLTLQTDTSAKVVTVM